MSKFINCTDRSQLPCDKYFVVINGNELLGYSSDKRHSYRLAVRKSTDGDYVELWYKYGNGRCHLVSYWN